MQTTKKTYLILMGFNALMYIAMSSYNSYIAIYYREIGLSVFQIGLLSAMGPIAAIIFQPIWAMLSDKTGKRIQVFRVVALLLAFTYLLYLPSTNYVYLMVVCFVCMSFSTSIIPLGEGVVINILHRSGGKFNFVRIGGSVGFLIMVSIYGFMFTDNIRLMFLCTTIGYLVLTASTWMLPKAPQAEKKPRGKLDFRSLFKNKKIVFVLCYLFCAQLVLGYLYSFMGIFIREMGYPIYYVGICLSIGAGTEVIVLLLAERILRRISPIVLLMISGIGNAIRIGVVILADINGSLPLLFTSQVIQGISFIFMYYSSVRFMTDTVPDEMRSTGQGVLYVVQQGFAMIVCNILGGYLGDALGMRNAYACCAIFIVVVTAIAAVIYKCSNGFDPPAEPAGIKVEKAGRN